MLLSKLKNNPSNPRTLSEVDFKKLLNKILVYPRLLEKNKITFDSEQDNTILGGNMRFKTLSHIVKEFANKDISKAIKQAQTALGVDNKDLLNESVDIFSDIIDSKAIPDEWTQDAKGLTAEEKEAFIIIDNVSDGKWDFDVLANEWDIDTYDWGLVDWKIEDDSDIELQAKEDDYKEPDNIKIDVKLGDLIEIGEHRLFCGDSTDSEQVAKLMNGEKADVAHNDPPYGMKKEKEGVLNDNLNYADLLDFNKEWISLQFTHLKENGSWYCWGIDEPLMDIYSEILKPFTKEQKATFRNLITWDKGNGQGQNSENTRSYAIADEKCLFVMCGVQGFNNNQDNYFEKWESVRAYLEQEIKKLNESDAKIATALGYKDGRTVNHWWSKSQWAFPTKHNYTALIEYAKSKNLDAFKKEYEELKKEYEELKKEYEELKKEYYSTRAFFNNTHDNFNNVWHFDRHKKQGDEGNHATPKPIPLCERVIKSSCPDNGLVLDGFLGSGSTMVAAHQLKRKCYGMELAPKYCQVIIDRMIKLDPSLIVKINGKEYKK